MKNQGLISESAGTPCVQFDLEQPTIPQFDHILELASWESKAILRIDVSERIIYLFTKELLRLTAEERRQTNSFSTIPIQWQWRGVPIRCGRALPDSFAVVIIHSAHTQTFRGEPEKRVSLEGFTES